MREHQDDSALLYDKSEPLSRFPNEEELIRYLYEEERLTQQQISQILGCCKATVLYKMRRYDIKARSKAEAQIIRHGHLRHSFDGDDRHRAYLIGFCVGDCHTRKLHETGLTIRVDCSSTRLEQIDLFDSLFSSFGHVWRSRPDEKGKILIVAYLDQSFDFLLDLKDEIPDFIRANDESFFAFFAGYTDAEGYMGINYRGQAEFRLQSYDRNILHQIHAMLLKVDIQCPKPWINRPKGYTDGKGIRSNRDCWCLQISGKNSLLTLFERITPYLQHPKRIQDMERALRNIEERSQSRQGVTPLSHQSG